MSNLLIAPSMLASDFANIQRDVEMINHSQADWFHIDIMDGVFVPNISFGIPVCEAINRHATKPLDVHLMIMQPERYLESFRKAGAEILTVHYEACPHLHRTIQQIKDLGAKAGVALNPHTPVQVLQDVIADLDLVLIMSVNPGFGGQKFIEYTYKKIKQAVALIEQSGSQAVIEIDGGVGTNNAALLYEAGARALVAGSSVFNSPNPTQTIATLKKMT
ncbi:MAG: ribulose-phosphate 3-epimerase [Runella slithyformis]|nr:MAG: ribulose-phosphate 3-epimerase [Runella slithyformis]TAF97734.1 MAG: ribulose-phosphate 3-epimerase [Runella sp.]TAG22730.1 MAG: ribulose-phosphate 3-epimerase [Cytophagales bacterium]TAG41802.1 MAG: ribulose-phosphate 3-epimerase [Cytophagia bacterium]TAF27659.1 MAG: ribulose-phosphate 3-epimerase [Runella slithyformis]